MLLVPALGATLTWEVVTRLTRGQRCAWIRKNYAQRDVDLSGGVAVAGAAVAAGTLACRSGYRGQSLILATAALVGAMDDGVLPLPRRIIAQTNAKGLRGHLEAARKGQITTGLLKLIAIPGTSLAVALTNELRAARAGNYREAICRGGLAAIAIAGSANLANLYDLRPGRALKISGINALALATATRLQRGKTQLPLAAATICALALPSDLREETMLGDTGANPLGALLGVAAVAAGGRWVPAVAIGSSTLILLSERISFSAVITQTPLLNWLDRLGTRQP